MDLKKVSPPVALLAVLLALLVAGQGIAWSFVLCIGESGHSAIEQSVHGKCGSDANPCGAEGGVSVADQESSCKDVPLSFVSLRDRSLGDDELFSAVSLPAGFPLSLTGGELFVRDLVASLYPQPPPRPYQALLALRTVILLN